ncbi:hypothetical protein JW766_03085 [Candidatus Dojkabacteria bacterium]|nr:hypothetical protein [Candidatus Dojkabacteria bacterium]
MTKFTIVPLHKLLPDFDTNGYMFSRHKFEELFHKSQVVIITSELSNADLAMISNIELRKPFSISAIKLEYPQTGDTGTIINLFEEVKRAVPSIASLIFRGKD